MPKIKSETGKSRVHIKAATLGGGLPPLLDLSKLPIFQAPPGDVPRFAVTRPDIPRVKIDKSQLNYKNPFGDVLIDTSVLTAQVGVYDKLKAEEATTNEQLAKEQQAEEQTVPRPNKKQRRLQKRSDFHKKLQQEEEERRKPDQKKVCLKEFKTMRSALSEVLAPAKPSSDTISPCSYKSSSSDMFTMTSPAAEVGGKKKKRKQKKVSFKEFKTMKFPSNDKMSPLPSSDMSSALADIFSTTSPAMEVTSAAEVGGKKKNRKRKSEHLIQPNNLRNVPKFLRKKRIQKNFDDILCFQQAIQQQTSNK